MKRFFATLPALALLAACGGGGAGPKTITGSIGGTPGIGGGSSSGSNHSFANPTVAKTYNAISAMQSFQYTTDDRQCCQQYSQLYSGNASTVRNPTTTVAYDPRDAIFTLTIKDPNANIDQTLRFQDPAHHTDFNGNLTPQWGVPNLAGNNVLFLQAGSGTGQLFGGSNSSPVDGVPEASSDVATFFYQKPGVTDASGRLLTPRYVSFAGYVRNKIDFVRAEASSGSAYVENKWKLERGTMVFGEVTPRSEVPTTGTGTYNGAFLATMINNPTADGLLGREQPDYFQWIGGTSRVAVDFAASTVALNLDGKVGAPYIDRYTNGSTYVPANADFTASGTARIDLPNTGGFAGKVDSAQFNWGTGSQTVTIAGSSVDGTFFGPNAAEVGGSFRIVGGIPDQRVDILGSFTAAK